jgi:hypothetical protein
VEGKPYAFIPRARVAIKRDFHARCELVAETLFRNLLGSTQRAIAEKQKADESFDPSAFAICCSCASVKRRFGVS